MIRCIKHEINIVLTFPLLTLATCTKNECSDGTAPTNVCYLPNLPYNYHDFVCDSLAFLVEELMHKDCTHWLYQCALTLKCNISMYDILQLGMTC